MKDSHTQSSTTVPTFATGGKIYVVCSDCGKIIRLNKPVFGSAHICTTEDERRQHRTAINREVLKSAGILRQLKRGGL